MNSLLSGDPESLLRPLSAACPCGQDLRYDPAYDHLRELMRGEREDLPVGIWEREPKRPDWQAAGRYCEELLGTRSKDLQLAAWLCESLVRRHGLHGLETGWEVFCGLLTAFWPEIHPQLEDADAELRLSPVYWMIQHSRQWLAECSGEEPAAEEARALLERLDEHVSRVDACLREHLGDDAPGFGSLIEQVKRRLAVLKPASAKVGDVEKQNTEAGLDRAVGAPGAGQELASRDDAYAAIGRIAEYLAGTEPHSPVPEILRAIAKWRDLGFGDLVDRMPEGKNSLYELIGFFRQR